MTIETEKMRNMSPEENWFFMGLTIQDAYEDGKILCPTRLKLLTMDELIEDEEFDVHLYRQNVSVRTLALRGWGIDRLKDVVLISFHDEITAFEVFMHNNDFEADYSYFCRVRQDLPSKVDSDLDIWHKSYIEWFGAVKPTKKHKAMRVIKR
jgi:hypothetical protein